MKEDYSFNIESQIFQELPKELQGQWRKEIEQAYSAGYEDATNKARQWLLEQMFELNACEEIYVADCDASTIEEFLDNFIKAMKEQQ